MECNLTAILKGGLGNQMFQIATVYSISKTLGMNMIFFKKKEHDYGQGKHPSFYYTNVFAKIPFVEQIHIDRTIPEKSWLYYPVIEEVGGNDTCGTICLDGFYQSEIHFQDHINEVKALFTPSSGIIEYLEKNSNIFELFPELKEEHDYAFIGIRRGDYIKYNTFHNPCGMDYYKKAMGKLGKKRYYIASDDMDWVRNNFIGDMFYYFDIEDDVIQLYTTALFNNYIISNSTFHWWGSFLSIYENPRILAPDKWSFGADVTFDKYWSIYRTNMEVIERAIES